MLSSFSPSLATTLTQSAAAASSSAYVCAPEYVCSFLRSRHSPRMMCHPFYRTTIPGGDFPVIRRNRNILEMAVATAIFGACAASAIPVSHAAQAASVTDDNDTHAASQTADQEQNKSKKEVANEKTMETVVVSGFVSSLENSIAIKKNSDTIDEVISAQDIGQLPGT